jgi:4-amino-4-deoxy-L-arabinose transferase-like glycosyltransferase
MTVFRAGFRFVQQHLLFLIILLSFFARFAAVFVVGDTELQHEYAPLVFNLAAGRGFVYYSVDQNNLLTTEFIPDPKITIPSAFKSLVYPLFLVFFVKLFGAGIAGMRVIGIFQAILGSLCCWLIYEISNEKFGKPQALLAAAGMAFYPLLIYSSTQISDTIIFLVLEILTFWLLIKLDEEFSAKIVVAFSFCFGLFMLARTEGILYFPFFLFWLFFRFPKWRAYSTVLFVGVCVMILVPWGLRNYFEMGKFVMNTAGGLNLWEGQNKDAMGVPGWYVEPPVSLPAEMAKEVFGAGFDRQFEIRQDRVYFENAIREMWAYPGHSLGLAVRKMLFFWTSLYFGFNFTYAGAKSALYWLPWLVMLPFFIYGLVLSSKKYKKYWVFYLVFLVSTLTCMLFVVLPRYTILVYPWVIVFASHGLWSIFSANFRLGPGH